MPLFSHMKHSFPKARYHAKTGQMRIVMSAEEEAVLSKEWGAPQGDVRYPKNPPLLKEAVFHPPVISIDLPEVE